MHTENGLVKKEGETAGNCDKHGDLGLDAAGHQLLPLLMCLLHGTGNKEEKKENKIKECQMPL